MADNLKLLLVNDNPMVLGILQHAWSSLAQGTRASDAADALLQAVGDSRAAGFATSAGPEWTAAAGRSPR